jgi:hypothetical protein
MPENPNEGETLKEFVKDMNEHLEYKQRPYKAKDFTDWNEDVDKDWEDSYMLYCQDLSLTDLVERFMSRQETQFFYITKKMFKKKLLKLMDIRDEEDGKIGKREKGFIVTGKTKDSDSSSDDEPKKKGEGIKRGPGRPKKNVMKTYSSSSNEESEKIGNGLKVKRGRPITVKGHKKCSCGSGLDVEPYKIFFNAMKANTALK